VVGLGEGWLGVSPALEDVVGGGDELPFAGARGQAASAKRLMRRLCLVCPKTGSTDAHRFLSRRRPRGVDSLAIIVTVGVGGRPRCRASMSWSIRDRPRPNSMAASAREIVPC
jgi:hypothetical protein